MALVLCLFGSLESAPQSPKKVTSIIDLTLDSQCKLILFFVFNLPFKIHNRHKSLLTSHLHFNIFHRLSFDSSAMWTSQILGGNQWLSGSINLTHDFLISYLPLTLIQIHSWDCDPSSFCKYCHIYLKCSSGSHIKSLPFPVELVTVRNPIIHLPVSRSCLSAH